MAKFCYILIIVLLGAILTHIAVVLLAPYYAGSQRWMGLKAELPAWQFAALPPQAKLSRTADPFFRQSFCRFDLNEAPARLSAAGSALYWSLALYNAAGENIYSLTSDAAPDGRLDLIAIDPAELMDFKHNLPDKYADAAFAPLNDGKNFAVLRVLVPSADRAAEVEAFLRSAQCRKADY